MAESMKSKVFGLNDSEETNDRWPDQAQEETPTPEWDFSGLDTDLDDADLDATSEKYVPIPQWTRTEVAIIGVTPSNTTNGTPRLKLDFQVLDDTWGRGKKINYQSIAFHSDAKWNWGAFLYAIGAIETPSDITQKLLADLFNNPDKLQGKVISAQVIGYSWKQRPGTMDPDFPRSYGKNAQPLPTDGTAYYEDLGRWARSDPEAKEKEQQDMSALAEFASSSLQSYM